MTRPPKQETRQERIGRQNRRGMVMLGVVVMAFVSVGGYVVANQPGARDKATGCRVGQVVAEIGAIVDRTDPFSRQQQVLLQASLEQFADSVPVDGRLKLYAFDGKEDETPAPLLARCRPPGGDDVNPLLVTPARANKAQAKSYLVPVTAKIPELIEVRKSSEHTHLVAYLATVAGKSNYGKPGGRHVFRIWSDMAEHTPAASLIGKRALDAKSFAAYAKQMLGNKLAGIVIEVVQVPSAATPPGVAKRIKEAWSETFSALGVSFTWNTL